MNTRVEHDLLGEREVPADAYWGIHTLRASENFALSDVTIAPELIRALAQVKKSCARANGELGYLDTGGAEAIERACGEVAAGSLADQFILDAYQGGAGTSTNMNVNEVIANRALEILKYPRGRYDIIHPLEHVNLHQSTNDVYPTALKIAAIAGVRRLSEATAHLQGRLQQKEKAWADIITIGRTEMQDAIPLTLGAQFSAFADAVSRDRWRTFKCEERLRVVNIGGTAVGTGLTAPRRYIFLVIERLRQITGYGLTRGENLVDQTANADALVEVSGILSANASTLTKIANDLRMLHYLGEIRLPPLQAGSSIMPGKINPVVCEAVVASALRVHANHTVVARATALGSFQIVEQMPLVAQALLESLKLLFRGNTMLAECIERIEPDPAVCRSHAYRSPMLITAFLPHIGYERAQGLVHAYQGEGAGETFKDFLVRELGVELVDRVLTSENIMALGFRDIHRRQRGNNDTNRA
ncbi:MAG: aspartate ammonia-lyase [Chitinivibrionales bacterium]|nr:aspartate ammonia-lyase [Chitinivibrionales bacterium]MBD3357134.1 aspartate ammonia-lyase [Chitinivibrionales bacterium]